MPPRQKSVGIFIIREDEKKHHKSKKGMVVNMRIAYAGIDLLCSALRTLLEDGHEVVRIFSCRTDNVYEFNTEVFHMAYERNIPVSLDRITVADLAELKKEKCDALICGGYYYRMPIDPELPMLNIHPALLPLGRGAWPMPVTILRGLPVSGVTIHKMAASFDMILVNNMFDSRYSVL